MSHTVARHIVVKNQIMEALQQGTLAKGGRLPSEDELALIYDVSRTTIRSALQALEIDGIIEKRHGSGNFVKPFEKISNRNATIAMLHGGDAAGEEMRSCTVKHTSLDERVASKLGLAPGTPAVEIKKHMYIGDVESTVKVERIPMQYIKIMPDVNAIPSSVYVFAARFCGIEIKEICSEILACPAEESPFEKIDRPVLRLQELFAGTDGNPILYSDYYMNTGIIRPYLVRNIPPVFWKVKDTN